MIIENKLNSCKTLISNIEVGECFLYEGTLHMRVDDGSVERKDINTYPYLILNLEKNRLNATKESVLVTRVKAKIIVE